jgi:RNA polymerase sigma factor (sigma-70 family)
MGGGKRRRETRSDDGCMSQAVWARLYRKFYPRVRTRLSAKVANEHDAEDLAQEVFLELARTKAPENPLFYLDAIARNLAAQCRRRRRAEQKALAEYLRRDESAGAGAKCRDAATDPAQGDCREEFERLLRIMAGRLSPRDMELVTLRLIQQLPIEQVARRMNCSPNAVSKRLQKLRPILRRLGRE